MRNFLVVVWMEGSNWNDKLFFDIGGIAFRYSSFHHKEDQFKTGKFAL